MKTVVIVFRTLLYTDSARVVLGSNPGRDMDIWAVDYSLKICVCVCVKCFVSEQVIYRLYDASMVQLFFLYASLIVQLTISDWDFLKHFANKI